VGRRASGRRRGALGDPRLHDHRARRDQRSAGAPGAHAPRGAAAPRSLRGILRANYPILREWIERRTPHLSHLAPEAGAIAFVRYQHDVNSTRLIERLRDESSVLVVPGDHFEMDGYLRIGFGGEATHLAGSLERIGALLDSIPARRADAR
jgi:aspartate/methionine/tyrosine aminotransferase